jgi:hypothetical protein
MFSFKLAILEFFLLTNKQTFNNKNLRQLVVISNFNLVKSITEQFCEIIKVKVIEAARLSWWRAHL